LYFLVTVFYITGLFNNFTMAKGFGYLVLCFCIIVGALYVSTVLSNLVTLPALSPATFAPVGVETINFNFFGKQDLTGKSYVTQGYGTTPYSYLYKNHWHDGIDIAASYGTTIYVPAEGTVVATGNMDSYCYHLGFGKYVAVKDPVNDLVLWYAHLGTINVSRGQIIPKGGAIGTVGATGYETGVHLHFSIFRGSNFTMQSRDGCGPEPTGQDVNPLNYLGSVYK
jgi:murein DD-endopeptidase MepM/ murein hydrolase activator NlpD